MLLRLEILGRYFSVETGQLEEPTEQTGPPDSAPQPMAVYPDVTDPVGFRLYADEDRRRPA